ncbi:DNA polymerase III subunit delta [Spirulina sp. 06S082]|uniref:DNA polymerase III subunit delta n=1 Tax=Spirulina sp. 06S082 TaxID=3110248 RepID=UPI002B1F8B82|nr:DNA polymerase III subunit delta [Spirulina sp. 06S082]MEA5468579.1 DNA polymerase III subunit delta [Spirulina sp. 06S082]
MIAILVGDDRYAIEREIAAYQSRVSSQWRHFNIHRFSSNALESAIACARAAAFGDGRKVVVVEECNFKQFGETGLELLQCLGQLPDTTDLIFVASAIDKRLKVSKHLLKFGKLKEFAKIPPWRTDLIAAAIGTQAKELNLHLGRDVVNYLADAIGNDTMRVESELQKLAVYASGDRLTKVQVRGLVPCMTQTNLQLAASLREGKALEMAGLLEELLARGVYPLAIAATLVTQFRTWLWVKAALQGGMRKDGEIARLCGIGNPKRLYFLRREVEGVSLRSLSHALTRLLDLEVVLKRGAKANEILPVILQIVRGMRQAV